MLLPLTPCFLGSVASQMMSSCWWKGPHEMMVPLYSQGCLWGL